MSEHLVGRPDRIILNRPTISEGDRHSVDAALASAWIGSGPEAASFEQELAEYLGVSNVLCTSSCTTAIQLLVMAAGIGPGSRVAVPTWTYPATALPAIQAGAEIVLVDCQPETLSIDVDSLDRAIGTGVDLVIPVHFAGVPVDEPFWDLCTSADVDVIEDAAHAFGASDEHGKIRGARSRGAAFSFHATKNLTCAEGGAIATEDAELAAKLAPLRFHGLDRDAWTRERSTGWASGDVPTPGLKANLPDVLAALGRSQLRTFDDRQRLRRTLIERYRSNLSSIDEVRPVPAGHNEGSADHMFVVDIVDPMQRPGVVAALAANGISSGLHYTPLHHLSWFAHNATVAPGGLSAADRMADRALTLPLHASLSLDDVDEVCGVLVDCLRGVSRP